MIVLYRE